MSKKPKRKYYLFLFTLFSLFVFFLGILNLKALDSTPPKILAAADGGGDEVLFWQNLVNKNPTFVDGLIRLAYLEYNLGNHLESSRHFQAAYKLSPNSPIVIEAKNTLGF